MSAAKIFLLRNQFVLGGIRRMHASSALRKSEDSVFDRYVFKTSGFNKYGLLEDDLENSFDPIVKEAVRRLPEKMQMERIYRAIKASQCDICHTILPEEEWTKFEDNHHYLQPYLEEVRAEKKEKEDWNARY